MRQRVLFGVALAALAAGATVAAILWAGRSEEAIESVELPEAASAPQVVELSPAKLAATGLQLAHIGIQRLQPVRRAPGRIRCRCRSGG